jgi:hypothetical protein
MTGKCMFRTKSVESPLGKWYKFVLHDKGHIRASAHCIDQIE